jgi:prepilin-type N-terminal cleavage/methylation domain-containing protein
MRQISQGGFTLLELTIVLVIVGLLAVGALKAASALRENAGISETSKRLNTLVTALQTFLMKHKRLPCPADPNSKLGKEERLNGECDPTRIITSNTEGVKVFRGAIPGHDLFSGSKLRDAWDHQFTYAVIAEATQDNSFTSSAWPAALELWRHKKAEGEPIRGVAVIISHGVNGSDAYLTTNKRPEELPQGEDEKANLDNDHIFVQADYSTNDDNPFDDQVLFLTEDQIVQPLARACRTKRASRPKPS